MSRLSWRVLDRLEPPRAASLRDARSRRVPSALAFFRSGCPRPRIPPARRSPPAPRALRARSAPAQARAPGSRRDRRSPGRRTPPRRCSSSAARGTSASSSSASSARRATTSPRSSAPSPGSAARRARRRPGRCSPTRRWRSGASASVDSIRDDAFDGAEYDVVVSCLASRTGGIKDSWDVDYQATKNVLDVARRNGAKHFVLLSAICVQKPLLTFQSAKLKFEEELAAAGDISYSIVRPTAFFKSLAGQVESVQKGGPYVMFGDGQLASCKPISERDLAKYMAECVRDPALENKVLPSAGPARP